MRCKSDTSDRRLRVAHRLSCRSTLSSTNRNSMTNIFTRQAKQLQASLMEIVDRVEVVKSEHEKLEGGNKFLQSYVLLIMLYDYP